MTVDNDAVVVSAVKLADDASGDVVVRLYESTGGRARVRLGAGFELGDLAVTDLLERPLAGATVPERAGDGVQLTLRPFELITLRFGRS